MEETVELDLREVFSALLDRIWLIILSAVLMASLVLGYTAAFITPQYQASVYMYVNNNSNNNTGNNAISSSELAVALQLVTTYVNIIKRDAVLEPSAERIAKDTGVFYTSAQLRGMLTAASVEETEIFEVRVSHPNPEMAAIIANAIAEEAPAVIASTIEGSSAKVIDLAKVPTSPYTPSYTKNALIGAAIGVFLAAAAVVLQVLLDKRIKSEEDLATISQVPVLGTIPDFMTEHRNSYYRYDTENHTNQEQ